LLDPTWNPRTFDEIKVKSREWEECSLSFAVSK